MSATRTGRIVFLFLALIHLASFGCERASVESNQPLVVAESPDDIDDPEIVDRRPIVEIWRELDGAVPIRGKSLHFRMHDDRAVEFDFLVSKDSTPVRRIEFSLRRTPLTMISDEEFERISSAAKKLLTNEDVNRQYDGPVGLTLDTSERITVVLYGNGAPKKTVVINDSDYVVISKKFAKMFPSDLAHLLREVRSLLDARTEEFTGCRSQKGSAGLTCPDVD